jgi:multiple sugar transport system substrate-binding protein
MNRLWLVLVCTVALVAVACGGPAASPGAGTPGPQSPAATAAGPGESPDEPPAESPDQSPAESPDAGESPAGSPAESPDAGESPAGSPAESPSGECVVETPASPDESVSGDLTLAGWSAGNVEDEILNCVLQKFNAQYPNVNVSFEVIAGEYPAIMLTRLGSGEVPDLFYVNQSFAQDFIDQGVLMDLNQMATDAGFATDAFYPNFLEPFQRDGATYAFPKDSSLLGMQTNDALLAEAGVDIPTTTDELVAAATALVDVGETTAPMCFAPEWQRAGAFVHGFGGGLVDDAGQPAIASAETRAGLQWYLDQYHNGLAIKPADIPADWCGQAFSRGDVAIAFEGPWIGPFMELEAPDVAYTVSAIPAGPAGQATLSFTVGYGMHPNTPNADASWALLSYLTGEEGMQEWVNGGLVLPARSDVEPQTERQQAYAAFADSATAGEGVTAQWGQVSSAVNGALAGASTAGGTVDSIVDAALPILEQVTAP